jgi:hypothetical protein
MATPLATELVLTEIADQAELHQFAWRWSWTTCSSLPIKALPRLKNLGGRDWGKNLQVSMLLNVWPIAVLPSSTP